MASGKKHLIIENREQMVPLSRLGKLLPRGPYCYRTILSWCIVGRRRIKSDARTAVKLERVKSHSLGWCSSVDAYWRFVEAINGEE